MPNISVSEALKKKLDGIKEQEGHTSLDSTIRKLLFESDSDTPRPFYNIVGRITGWDCKHGLSGKMLETVGLPSEIGEEIGTFKFEFSGSRREFIPRVNPIQYMGKVVEIGLNHFYGIVSMTPCDDPSP